MSRLIKISVCLLLLLSVFQAFPQKRQERDSTWCRWNFRLSPYIWFIGLDGDVIRPPEPPVITHPIYTPPEYEVKVRFREISSSIKFIGMFTGVYRNKHLVTLFHFTGFVLESQAITPHEFLFQNSVIRLDYYSGDFEAGYRIIKSNRVDLDILAGIKVAYDKIAVATDLLGIKTISGERDEWWLEPILAVSLSYRPWYWFELTAFGEWGPDYFDRDYSYQYMGGINFIPIKNLVISLEYQDQYLRLPREDAIYNGHIRGPLFRLGVQF